VTIHVPKWFLFAAAAVVVVGGIAGGAYLLGRSSGDDGSSVEASAGQTESAAQPPECTESSARTAVIGSDFESDIRELNAVRANQGLFKVYVVGKLVCHDFTEDGIEEMFVQLSPRS
jgi:hypothetical protein